MFNPQKYLNVNLIFEEEKNFLPPHASAWVPLEVNKAVSGEGEGGNAP